MRIGCTRANAGSSSGYHLHHNSIISCYFGCSTMMKTRVWDDDKQCVVWLHRWHYDSVLLPWNWLSRVDHQCKLNYSKHSIIGWTWKSYGFWKECSLHIFLLFLSFTIFSLFIQATTSVRNWIIVKSVWRVCMIHVQSSVVMNWYSPKIEVMLFFVLPLQCVVWFMYHRVFSIQSFETLHRCAVFSFVVQYKKQYLRKRVLP